VQKFFTTGFGKAFPKSRELFKIAKVPYKQWAGFENKVENFLKKVRF
jgi:hypothetical protein